MTLLLLRGPQTVNELRTRAERMYTFASPEEVEIALAELAARDEPHVVRLERQIGQKELRWRQLIAEEAEPSAVPARPSVGTGTGGGLAERVAQLEAGHLELEERVAKLEVALRDLL
jgi:hypothetical protein